MEKILAKLSREVSVNYPLAKRHLFKKKTGNAKFFYELCFDETMENDLKVFGELYKENLPFVLFSQGTNLLISERGYDGLFVAVGTKGAGIKFDEKTSEFHVSANATVGVLVKDTTERGYDFSPLTGVPGLVGAGIVGNSGWPANPTKRDFDYFVKRIKVFDLQKGEFEWMTPDGDFFGTRDSFLKQQNKGKTRYIVVESVLASEYIGKENVKELVQRQTEERRESSYFGFKEGTAGSVFSGGHIVMATGKKIQMMLSENPDINIDANGATFSSNGARLFKTEPHTTDKDVAKWFSHVTQKVKEYYGHDLHKEVVLLDYDGEVTLPEFLGRYDKKLGACGLSKKQELEVK
ncbi:MAG: FAD-binding protein [Firmicutes bacterium]|nr:FAD-binding protein [Bacillota bacterium]